MTLQAPERVEECSICYVRDWVDRVYQELNGSNLVIRGF